MPRFSTVTASAAALVLLATACSSTNEGGTGEGGTAKSDGPDDAAWTQSTDPVPARGLVWAEGGVVHLSDGTTVDTGSAMTTYVVAGDGVYFTPAASEDDVEHGNMTTGPLHFADRDGEVSDTGLTVYVESIGSSPDGRFLGLVDATSGPKDDFSDYPQATAVVVDLSTGERVVDTTDGMGAPDEDDLAHDYPEVYLGVRFPDDETAFVEGLGDHVFALPDGTGEPTDEGIRSPTDPVSPDGSWSIDDRGYDDRIRSTDGDPVEVSTGTPRRELRWWLDASTVVGIAIDGPGAGLELGPRNTSTLVTCQVPDGTCTPVEGTQGERIRFPVGAGDEGLDLGATGGGS
jgi:hypothetical protein